MVRRSPDPRTEKDGLDREVRASSFVQGAMREGLPTSFVADGLSGRIRSYGERYFESPGLIEALTGGMLANSLLRPTSVSVRRWVAENIDALDRDDASVVLALSVIDSVEIEEALARSLPHGRTEGLA